MTDSNRCPDRRIWSDWLNQTGEVAVSDQSLVSHLDHCAACQRIIETLSRQDPFYDQSRNALQSMGLSSHDWRASESPTSDNFANESASPAMVSLVKSLLGPTDDERSLGRLGRFEVSGIVGSGGMGIVLKARSIDMDRVVAIKIPQPQYWQSPETLITLEREARSAAAVVHPNVISIYHVDRYKDVPYLVMPYFAGQTLEQRIRESGSLSIAETLRIGRQVAAALAAAHACGVVHRDVKPANILLGAGTERAVLSDFGLAKVQSDATCTATATFAGTPIYLSPEQASGLGAGPASDLYSLGTVIWTMAAGRPPLSGMHTHAIVRKIAEGQLPKFSETCPDAPSWLQQMLIAMHADAPADRPSAQRVTEWIEACQRNLADGGLSPIPHELIPHCAGIMKRKRARYFVGIIALAAAAVLLAGQRWGFDRSDHHSTDRSQTMMPAAMTTTPSSTSPNSQESPASQEKVHDGDPVVTKPGEPISSTDADERNDGLFEQISADLQTIHEKSIPDWDRKIDELLIKEH